MLQKTLTYMAIFLALAALIVASVAIWGAMEYTKKGPLRQKTMVEIPQGASIRAMADILGRQSVISTPLVFEIAARLKNSHAPLQAGEYEFAPFVSMKKVLHKLQQGKIVLHQVTIPEGLTNYQIAGILKNESLLKGEIQTLPPEGYLLPETYSFRKDLPRQTLIDRMHKVKKEFLKKIWQGSPDLPGIETVHDLITLASIVEKETGQAKERARVAGVFLNRLEKNMRLQSDPTVIYALTAGIPEDSGKGPLGRRLLRKDLDFDSPYNTYRYAGLPPGPICNPGRQSVRAVLNPKEHDYLYFVADGTGGHVFSKTLKEHNRNAARWREIRRRAKDE